MATPRQLAANRENALRSTGPRSLEGKKASSMNALKHGLTSRGVLLHSEDPEEFNGLLRRLRKEHSPVGVLESSLVDRIAVNLWRLQRIVRMENGVLARHIERGITDRARGASERIKELIENPDQIEDPEEALELLEEGQKGVAAMKRLLDPEFLLVSAFEKASERGASLEALSRYETTVERRVYRALHELQRLQATRLGQKVIPPISVDVTA